MLTMLRSKVRLSVTLPVLAPTVNLVLVLSVLPSPTCDRVVVSDSHAVRSHADAPPEAQADMSTSPSPAPCRVTLADPVDPLFNPACTDTLPPSIETAPDTLPIAIPTVTSSTLLPDCPAHIMLRNAVSLTQTDSSLAVPPDETAALSAQRPVLDP